MGRSGTLRTGRDHLGLIKVLILESPGPFELCGSIEAILFFQLKDGISFLLEGRADTALLQSNAHLS